MFCFIKINFWEWYFKLLIAFYFLTDLVHILKMQGLCVVGCFSSEYMAAASCFKTTSMLVATSKRPCDQSQHALTPPPLICSPLCFPLRFSLGWCYGYSHFPVQQFEKARSDLHFHPNSCLQGRIISHRSLLSFHGPYGQTVLYIIRVIQAVSIITCLTVLYKFPRSRSTTHTVCSVSFP